MRIGLVGCSKLKLPVPAPAWLLYSASPRFSQTFQTARAECDAVRILSAKHGMVLPEQILAPYDLFLSDLPVSLRQQWGMQVQGRLRALSGVLVNYCSQEYSQWLAPLPLVQPYTGDLFARAQAMGRHGALRRIDWPMRWVLEFLQTSPGVSLQRLSVELRQRGYQPVTIQCQLQRVRRCPLYRIQHDRVWARYREVPCDALVTHENIHL